ncbi:hypothetical protein IG631_15703 [Alternaria alternata]|nr:hypothetical protein IG631_15703 [Alternaria alternata]
MMKGFASLAMLRACRKWAAAVKPSRLTVSDQQQLENHLVPAFALVVLIIASRRVLLSYPCCSATAARRAALGALKEQRSMGKSYWEMSKAF